MMSIKEILYRLVSVQSDTGTRKELKMADTLYKLMKENRYFKNHPEYYGRYLYEDVMDRPVVWALKPGKTKKTVILLGHYDAVELGPYGKLKDDALDPVKLKQRLRNSSIEDEQLRKDLEDDDWEFGRGMADMKAGLAINLSFVLSEKEYDATLLFVSVPDEENLSSGARQAVHLYQELQEKHDLHYEIALLDEPETKDSHDIKTIQVFEGSFGKIMPVVLTKGVLSHVANISQGLNSAYMLAEIVRRIEINPDFVTHSLGQTTTLPTTLMMQDLKTTYDVSTPQYSAASFNILFVDSKKPLDFLGLIQKNVEQALHAVTKKYQQSFEVMAEAGNVKEDQMIETSALILTIEEAEEKLQAKQTNFKQTKQTAMKRLNEEILAGTITIQEAGLIYLKELVEQLETNQPVVIIGFVPPYYPAVTNRKVNKKKDSLLEGVTDLVKESFGGTIKSAGYMSNVCDISYLMNASPKEDRQFLNHLALSPEIYDIPVEEIAELNIPVFMIGPTSRDIHEIGERVFMPDVEKRIPLVIEKVIENVGKK